MASTTTTTHNNNNSYRVAQVSETGGNFEIVQRTPIPEPKSNEVLLKVEACGVCHSDHLIKDGIFPGVQFPRVLGHEIIGRIVKLGSQVNPKYWHLNDRVGVGWHGGHCFQCDTCRRGDFLSCVETKVTGASHDGGFGEYVVVPHESIARVPDDLTSEEAAPLLCAGVTVYNSMRNSGARAGDLVVIVGIGGLGHLAIQFARKMGFHTIAISTSDDKKSLAIELGADKFINTSKEDPVQAINQMGGAKLAVITAPSGEIMTTMSEALGTNGTLLLVGAGGEVKVSPMTLIMKRANVSGWPSGTAYDSEETMKFAALSGVKSVVETLTLTMYRKHMTK